MDVFEYTPLEIKSAVTGDGRAKKEQVIFMVKQLIKTDGKIKYDDEFGKLYEEINFLSHTPIIALTANALKGDKEKFLIAGMDEYITKPIKEELLLDKLNKLLPDDMQLSKDHIIYILTADEDE